MFAKEKKEVRKMSIHYKFKTALEFSTLTFNGDHISLQDLKTEIIKEKSLQCDLQIIDADTKEGTQIT